MGGIRLGPRAHGNKIGSGRKRQGRRSGVWMVTGLTLGVVGRVGGSWRWVKGWVEIDHGDQEGWRDDEWQMSLSRQR